MHLSIQQFLFFFFPLHHPSFPEDSQAEEEEEEDEEKQKSLLRSSETDRNQSECADSSTKSRARECVRAGGEQGLFCFSLIR